MTFYVYVIAALILAIILIIGSLLLLVPFRVSPQFDAEAFAMRGRVVLSWLGLTLFRREIPGKRVTGREKEKEKKRKPRGGIWRLLSLSPDSARTLLPILRAVGKSVSVQELSGGVVFGFDDPADTAVASGLLWSAASVVSALPRTSLSVSPDFGGERLDASVRARIRVRLLRVALSFVRALMKKPFRDLLRAMRR